MRMDTGQANGNLFYTVRLKKWKNKSVFKSVFMKKCITEQSLECILQYKLFYNNYVNKELVDHNSS